MLLTHMHFSLQYRDVADQQPLVEFNSPYPFPIPRLGDLVVLSVSDEQELRGTVERIEWGYLPRMTASDNGEAPHQSLTVITRVYLAL